MADTKGEDFFAELNGAAERDRTHVAARRGRDTSKREGLRPSSALRKVQVFDIGNASTTDMQGRPLYQKHKVEDDDDTTIDTLMHEWDRIPDAVDDDGDNDGGVVADLDYVDGESSDEDEACSSSGEEFDELSPTE